MPVVCTQLSLYFRVDSDSLRKAFLAISKEIEEMWDDILPS